MSVQIAAEISELFKAKNLMWKIGGVRKVPTAEDVQAVLDKAESEMEYQERFKPALQEIIQIEMTHLLFRREDGKTKVFVAIGELGNHDNVSL